MSQQTEERNSSTIQTTRFSPSWPQEPLVNLIDKQRGISYGIVQPGQHDPDGVPIIRVNNIKNGALDLSELRRVAPAISASYRRTILRGGELLLTIVGTVGESLIASDNQAGWNVARAIAVIPVREEISSQWVRVCLRSAPLQGLIKDWCNTTVQPTLNLSDVAKLPIPLPPQKTRNRIAEILGRLDDKIEVNRRINRTLEAMAQALYKHWFVDFGPFQDGEFVESELGLIPKGWTTTTLKEITTKIGSGATPLGGSSVYIDDGVYLIRSQNIYDSHFEWNGLAKITDEAAAKLSNVTVAEGDVLINITGDSILRTCVADCAMLPARVNQHVAIIRTVPGMPPHFIHQHLLRTETKDMLLNMSSGATRKAITKANLENTQILLPPTSSLSAFRAKTDPFFAQISINNRESQKLTEIRDYLLPKLLSGEIPVEAAVEALATSRNDNQQILETVKHPLK